MSRSQSARHPLQGVNRPRTAAAPLWRRGKAPALAVLACSLIAAGGTPAAAINIVMNFDAGSDSPVFDPGATMLQAMADDAASIWEDIFEDAGTVTITYRYDSINGLANGTANSVSGGRPVTGTINVDSDNVRTWFFDATPLNHSEYDFTQNLFRDLSAGQQAAWYNSTPPALLEASFRGTANSSAPVAAQNGFDMFSTLVHEIGHVLGLSHSGMARPETVGEGDFDFDVSSTFNAGNFFAIEAAGTDPDDVNDWAHIAAQSLMCRGCAATGLRRLPSATDVFAIASAAGWSTDRVDLPRQDFLSPLGTDWNTAGNWEGNQVPGSADDAFVRNGNNLELSADGRVENLLIDEDSSILTNDNHLIVDDTATIGSLTDAVLQVADINGAGTPEFTANRLVINDSSTVQQIGDTSVVDVNSQLIINEGGLYLGSGTLNVENTLRNDGTLSGGAVVLFITGGELIVNADGGNTLDLDGTSGDGVLNATIGDLTLNGPQRDEFDGEININDTRTMRFNDAWEMRGVMNLEGNGDPGDDAVLAGSTVTISGDVNVDGANNRITAATVFEAGAQVSLPNADDDLELDATTTFSGGTFSGNGTLHQDGHATVTSGSTVNIDVGSYDWDGNNVRNTTVNNNATMNITGGEISDDHDGIITINGGTVHVMTGTEISLGGGPPLFLPNPWTMSGELNLSSSGTLSGVLVNIEDTVNTTGRGIISAPVDFEANADVNVATSNDVLELNGTANYKGGSFLGAGRIQHDGNVNVDADTTIGSPSALLGTFDWDGATGTSTTAIDPGVTFTIYAGGIDTGDSLTNGFDDIVNINSGVLTVNTGTLLTLPPPSLPILLRRSWLMSGVMNLNNTGGGTPTVNGSQMRVDNQVNVTGGLAEINAATTLLGGSINVDGSSTLRQDGAFVQQGGTVDVEPGGVVHFNGSATFESGTRLVIDGTAELNANSTFQGGIYTGSGILRQDGDATVDASTRLGIDTRFRSGSTTTISAPAVELALSNSGVVRAGASFNGTGRLRNRIGSTLVLEDGAQVGVHLVNDGVLEIGSSPGAAVAVAFDQGASADLEIEIGGLLQGDEYDWLKVADDAVIDGDLNVSLIDLGGGLFEPMEGDVFEVLSAGNSLSGTFLNTNLPVLSLGLGWSVSYLGNAVRLSVDALEFLEADFDKDGDVDGEDFLIWQTNFITPAGATHNDGDADGDGDVDGGDFLIWQTQFGAMSGGGGNSIPEPTGVVLLLTIAAAAATRRR